jgi:hypothetical protein
MGWARMIERIVLRAMRGWEETWRCVVLTFPMIVIAVLVLAVVRTVRM